MCPVKPSNGGSPQARDAAVQVPALGPQGSSVLKVCSELEAEMGPQRPPPCGEVLGKRGHCASQEKTTSSPVWSLDAAQHSLESSLKATKHWEQQSYRSEGLATVTGRKVKESPDWPGKRCKPTTKRGPSCGLASAGAAQPGRSGRTCFLSRQVLRVWTREQTWRKRRMHSDGRPGAKVLRTGAQTRALLRHHLGRGCGGSERTRLCCKEHSLPGE